MNRTELLKNWKASKAELLSNGFYQVCSTMAGENSGSLWAHSDGRRAEIKVRNNNKVVYS